LPPQWKLAASSVLPADTLDSNFSIVSASSAAVLSSTESLLDVTSLSTKLQQTLFSANRSVLGNAAGEPTSIDSLYLRKLACNGFLEQILSRHHDDVAAFAGHQVAGPRRN
jgi:hypothetical protein